MSPRTRSLLFVLATYVAFFASGASSLFAEVTWNRMLIVVVGNSMSATAIITGVFMGGLGIGSYVAGKLFARRPASLVPYAILERGIGTCILLSPTLFSTLSVLFSALADSFSNRGGLTLARALVNIFALFVPALLMGATFPALISGAAPTSSVRTARVGFLYGINTLGAAAGSFAAGYYLLPEYGVRTALVTAFSLNLVAACCACAATALTEPAVGTAGASVRPDVGGPGAPASVRRFLGVAVFAIGFVALAYEILLTRLGMLFIGDGLVVFPLVLTAFLLGTGISAMLGTWAYGMLQRHAKHSDKLFGLVALGAGALVMGTPYLLIAVGRWGLAYYVGESLPIYWFNIAIIVVPTVLIGALLPIAIRMLRPADGGEATRAAATFYALGHRVGAQARIPRTRGSGHFRRLKWPVTPCVVVGHEAGAAPVGVEHGVNVGGRVVLCALRVAHAPCAPAACAPQVVRDSGWLRDSWTYRNRTSVDGRPDRGVGNALAHPRSDATRRRSIQ